MTKKFSVILKAKFVKLVLCPRLGSFTVSITGEEPSKSSLRRGSSADLIEKSVVIPPDGGWGWVVMIGSFFCNLVVDGIIYTLYGGFLQDIGETFKTTPKSVANGNSILMGFFFVSGPFTYGMINQCGFQLVGFVGGTLAGFGFLVGSMIYSSFYGFIIILGMVGGIGLGMVYLPSMVIVGYYFERWRALTTSIAVTGSAVGIMLFPLILDLACDWRIAFKSITGACFLCTFLSFIYRPLHPVRVITRDGAIIQFLETNESYKSAPQENERTNIFRKCWTNCKKCTEYKVEPMDHYHVFSSTLLPKKGSHRRLSKSASHSQRPSTSSRGQNEVDASVTDADAKGKWQCCQSIQKILFEMLNFKLLKSPSFLLLAFSGCASFMGISIPYIYITERADQTGINEKYSFYFYTVLGLSNAIGRIICGIVSAFPQAEALIISYISLTISGIASMGSFFLFDVYSQFAYNSIFGLTTACVPCLRTTIVADLFGLENLAHGFGLLMLFHGLGSFIATPLANAFIHVGKSYNAAFLYAGCILLLSAIMLMPLNRISTWEQAKEEEQELYNYNTQ